MNDGYVPPTEAISATLQNILDSVNASFEQEGVPLPERQYYTVGQTAHDCEQLTVTLLQFQLGGPGDEPEKPLKCNAARTVVLVVELIRCIPVSRSRGEPVTPERIAEATDGFSRDAWLLMEGVLNSSAADYLGALADIEFPEPEDIYQTIRLNLTVGVE